VEAALVKVDGYKEMKASVAAQQVIVTYDPKKTTPKALVTAINEGTEFRASIPSTKRAK
jgi:copper chaperone CopZ